MAYEHEKRYWKPILTGLGYRDFDGSDMIADQQRCTDAKVTTPIGGRIGVALRCLKRDMGNITIRNRTPGNTSEWDKMLQGVDTAPKYWCIAYEKEASWFLMWFDVMCEYIQDGSLLRICREHDNEDGTGLYYAKRKELFRLQYGERVVAAASHCFTCGELIPAPRRSRRCVECAIKYDKEM